MHTLPFPARKPASVPSSIPDAPGSWGIDDDIALGCESANPALQIDSWGDDEGAGPISGFN